ncbi:hypothetical protein [Mangrovactinospora gilvigrisea]|uniref:hypothetical protein n=1 Tax=Mangrovactinospora gilvigrisea TaxID=1428644 RepID=UPI000AF3D54A|nr:hypothetical protein [Mangrovactinospora gilvigrisea]
MAHDVETESAEPAQKRSPGGEDRHRKEMKDCLSCLTLLVFGLLMVYVVGRLSFTPPGK